MPEFRELYLTLPSDAYMDKFSTNSAADWYTKLLHSVNLKGQWELCLSELQYMQSMFTLQTEQKFKVILFTKWRCVGALQNDIKFKTKDIFVPPGYYKTGEDLLNCIRSQMPEYGEDITPFTIAFVGPNDH
ncbi:hypothetical protein RvY_02003 [Ramazzottius varieornatus]|uniref:Uncharacterized protein n=1 Tax=Ramazzottius varieornatus TaxID=947166 RepID=A0A1D1UI98_RAMVA|nr:hypothetical protein RvY_02003 [Ramazzottius varieornatus]